MKSTLYIKNTKNLNSHPKIYWFLFLSTLFIIFSSNIITCKEKKKKEKTEEKNLSKTSSPLQDYFYIQRMYPGNDILDALKESEFSNSKKFLEINDNVIFFARSLEKKSEIEDSLNISEIYDPQYDNVEQAKCCSRVIYEEFPLTNSLTNIIPAMKNDDDTSNKKYKGKSFLEIDRKVCTVAAKAKGPGTTVFKPKDMPITKVSPVTVPSPSKKQEKKIKQSSSVANLCILIHVPDEAKWRICSDRKSLITRLYVKIIYSVLKLKSNNNPKILEKIMDNPKIFSTPSIGKWDWDHQNKWQNRCNSNFMQSPINIQSKSVKEITSQFSLGMHLTDVHTMVKKNFGEIIVVFLNFGGVLKIAVEGTYLMFTPQYMSFRFPGETIIDGVRSHGDIQIHFAEISSKTGTSVTNGLILNIPLKPNNKKTNIEEFDNLNLEFWRHEVMKKGVYTPKKFMNKKLMRFSLDGLSKRIVNMSPQFMVHMGSETIPPCKENIIHISLDKPLELPGCQFKLLRENSLISSRPKEIHTRTEVPTNDRTIYKFNKKSMDYIPSIEGIVPQSFNKYLLTHGITYKNKRKTLFRTKTKSVVKIGKNGKPMVVKIKVKSKVKTKQPSIITKALMAKKVQKRGGFGPGFSKGKNRIFTSNGEHKAGISEIGSIDSEGRPTSDKINCDVLN